MFTLRELVRTCTNEWERILVYTNSGGLVGVYTQLDAISEKTQIGIVRNWNYRDNALYILI
jgi:hypothetical protein